MALNPTYTIFKCSECNREISAPHDTDPNKIPHKCPTPKKSPEEDVILGTCCYLGDPLGKSMDFGTCRNGKSAAFHCDLHDTACLPILLSGSSSASRRVVQAQNAGYRVCSVCSSFSKNP